MIHRTAVLLFALCLAAVPAFSQETGKDQSQVTPEQGVEPQPGQSDVGEPPPADQGEDLTSPDNGDQLGTDNSDEVSPDDMSLGEIPKIETIELTPDLAKRAVDTFVLVREKYKDANLEEYENLQDFVDQTDDGKKFDADVKANGFGGVNEWNIAITTVGFAYSALTDDQTGDVRLQIEEIEKDTSIAQDLKDKMVASLNAMIPSDNNRKVVQAMIEDPAYAEKLKLLAEEE